MKYLAYLLAIILGGIVIRYIFGRDKRLEQPSGSIGWTSFAILILSLALGAFLEHSWGVVDLAHNAITATGDATASNIKWRDPNPPERFPLELEWEPSDFLLTDARKKHVLLKKNPDKDVPKGWNVHIMDDEDDGPWELDHGEKYPIDDGEGFIYFSGDRLGAFKPSKREASKHLSFKLADLPVKP